MAQTRHPVKLPMRAIDFHTSDTVSNVYDGSYGLSR
jgi:hypothetical protein